MKNTLNIPGVGVREFRLTDPYHKEYGYAKIGGDEFLQFNRCAHAHGEWMGEKFLPRSK